MANEVTDKCRAPQLIRLSHNPPTPSKPCFPTPRSQQIFIRGRLRISTFPPTGRGFQREYPDEHRDAGSGSHNRMQQVQHPISRRHHAMCQLAGWTVAGVMLMLPGLHAMSMGQHGLLRGQRRMLPVRR